MRKKTYLATGLLLAASAVAARAEADVAAGLVGTQITVENKTAALSGGNLAVSMDINLSGLRMKGRNRVVLTPAVRGEGGATALMPEVVVNGRRQDIEYRRGGSKRYGDDATEVRRRNGTEQSVHYTAVLPAEEWMRDCDIVLGADLCGCGESLGGDEGLVLSLRDPSVVYMRPEAAPKTREISGSAYIDFPVDQTTLYPDYHRNPTELQKIIGTINEVREDRNVTIDNIDIRGFASPESPYEHNAYLAENRARTLKEYVRGLMSLDEAVFTSSHVPENWEGLRALVEGSDLAHRAEILELIDSDMDPDAKEAQIKRSYPQDYSRMLSDFYPWLRRSDYTITYTVRPFSVEEAREMYLVSPAQLSMEEMYLVAQTMEPGSDEFRGIFETAVHMFPDDPTANLNAACMEIERGDLEAAAAHLDKAGENAHVWNARGVIAYRRGDSEAAEALYRRAAEAGLEGAADNLDKLTRRY